MAFAAAVRKEWQVMIRYWPNMVTLLVASVLIPAGYCLQAAGFSGGDERAVDAFASRSGTSEVAGFIYVGWAVFMWITQMIWGPGMALRKERMQGSLELVFLTPVSRLTVLFGPATAHLIPAAVLFTIVGLMLRFAFGMPLGPGQLIAGVVIVVASIPVLFALGGIVAVVVLRFRDAEGISDAVRGFIGILCGITYPIAVLPDWIQPISRTLPPTQVLDSLRWAVLRPAALPDTWARALLLVASGLGIGIIAMVLLGRALRSARRTGRLGQY